MDRMYKLLGCTCIREFNELELDPVHVINYFRTEKERIEEELARITNAALRLRRRKELLDKSGCVYNSLPQNKAEKAKYLERYVVLKRHPEAQEEAEYKLRVLDLYTFELPLVLVVTKDDRVTRERLLLHDFYMSLMASTQSRRDV